MRMVTQRPAADQRKRDLAAIHLLALQLGLDTADKAPSSAYRQMLLAQGGKASAADLDDAARTRVLAYLRKAAGQVNRAGRPNQGGHEALINRLWQQLGDMGALKDPSERGLHAFVKSLTRVSHPRFLPATSSNRIVETLKSWINREAAKKNQAAAEP